MTESRKAPAVVRFRALLFELVARDLTVRYRGSLLGVAWTIVNPLLFMLIYSLVFSVFMRSSVANFPLFLLSGMIPWGWITSGIMGATGSISGGSGYVGKTLMPTELLVLVPVLSGGVNYLIMIALLFPIAIYFGVNVLWAIVFLPVLMLIQLCIILGFGFLLASVNVFFRDLEQVMNYVFTALFFLSPIFYPKSSIPPNLQFIVKVNPFASLISAYHNVFFNGIPPDPTDLLLAAATGAIVLVVGLAYFNARKDVFPENV